MSSTTTGDVEQVAALVLAQASVRDNITAQASAIATSAARSFDGWYDSSQITDWATTLAGRLEPLQRVLARATDAYLARTLSVVTGRRTQPVGAIDLTDLRLGMTHAGAYGKVADAYRWQQAQLDTATRDLLTEADPQPPVLQTPLEAATDRARAVAEMDAQLVVRAQAQQNLLDAHERGRIIGYRRVIHPELSRGGTCGLCVAASHRLYHVKELMPIHHRCNCVPTAVVEGRDPGAVVNDADLARLYKEAGSTGAADLKRTRYKVTDSGALGPILEPEKAARRIARRTPDRPAKTEAQKLADLQKVRDGLIPALGVTREKYAADPKKWGSYLKSLETRIAQLDRDLGH